MPDRFLRKETGRLGITLPPAGQYGAGLVFLPRDAGARAEIQALFEQTVIEEGQVFLGWRDVPTSDAEVGPSAVAVGLFITHFGTVTDVREHLRRFRLELDASARGVKATLAGEGSDEERIRRFVDDMRAHLRRGLSEEDARSMEMAAPFAQLWQGLARYWRKKAA